MYVCGVVECVSLWNSLWSGLVSCCRPSSAVVAVALLPEACCHVCMYVWPTGTEILLVVLFWRPDLTLLLWLIGDIVQKVSSVFFRHTTCIQTGYHTYIHIRMRQLLARRVCMYVCMYVCIYVQYGMWLVSGASCAVWISLWNSPFSSRRCFQGRSTIVVCMYGKVR